MRRGFAAKVRSERGTTLIEMLVATGLGMIVMLAAIMVLEVVQSQSAQVEARAEASQRGRGAMQQVTQRLRSQICSGDTARGTAVYSPVKEADANSVTFYSDLPTRNENDGEFKPELRRILVSGSPPSLREQVYDGVGVPPNVSYPRMTRERLLLHSVKQVDASTPYFRYYTYDAATPAQPTVRLTSALADADKKRVVKIVVAFKPATLGKLDPRVDSDFINSVTNRFANPYGTANQRGPECL